MALAIEFVIIQKTKLLSRIHNKYLTLTISNNYIVVQLKHVSFIMSFSKPYMYRVAH